MNLKRKTLEDFRTAEPHLYDAIVSEVCDHITAIDQLIAESDLPNNCLTERTRRWIREGTLAEAKLRLDLIRAAVLKAQVADGRRSPWHNRVASFMQGDPHECN